MDVKPINPKDGIGISKTPISVLPAQVLLECGLALYEGDRKYGRSNYRVAGVRASVYYDACMRHLMEWWEGVDIDKESGVSHVTKAIAGLMVLRDSMLNGNWKDDRPPKVVNTEFLQQYNEKAKALVEKHKNPVPAWTELNKNIKR